MNFSKRQIINFIVSGIFTIGIYLVIIRPVLNFIKYRYSVVFDDYQQYAWVLNDTIKLDTLFSGIGRIRKSDQYYSYLLKNHTYIEIFEYKDLNNIEFNKINYSFRYKFPSFENIQGIILNEELDNTPVISIKNKLTFQNNLRVEFNKNAQLKLIRDTIYCKVYVGNLTKMLLSNSEDEPLVLFDFISVKRTLIAFYKNKKRNKFLLIIVTSDRKPLDESFIHLLKLK